MQTSNYADTMASLLALLSHPAEITDAEEGLTSKSVVFIIDEFDLFATHARQTLLYNLFDIAQAKKAPIAVLGLTTRIDVVETLEKRVKSRFSHRYVYMSQPKTLPAFWKLCRQGLVVDDEDLEKEGLDMAIEGAPAFQKWWTDKIEVRHPPLAYLHVSHINGIAGLCKDTRIRRPSGISVLCHEVGPDLPDVVDTAPCGALTDQSGNCTAVVQRNGVISGPCRVKTSAARGSFGSGIGPAHFCGTAGYCRPHGYSQFCDGIRRVHVADGQAARPVGGLGDAGARSWGKGMGQGSVGCRVGAFGAAGTTHPCRHRYEKQCRARGP